MDPSSESVHFLARVVEREGGPGSGGDPEKFHDRLGAVVSRAHGDTLAVEDGSDVLRVHARSGVPREAQVTPRELAQRMAARGDGAAQQVAELTELYYAAEWGRRTGPAAEQRAADLAREIRAMLRAARRAPR